MDLVNKAVVFLIEHCITGKKGSQKKRTAGSINPSQPRHDSIVRKNKLFGFAQNLSFLVRRIRWTCLVHDVAVLLGINARATGEKQPATRENVKEIPRSLQINPTIFFRLATAVACT